MAANSSRKTYGIVTRDGPVSKLKPSPLDDSEVAADRGRLLAHGDLVAERCQPGGAGQAPDARTDHDDAAHSERPFQVSVPALWARTERAVSPASARTESRVRNASGQTRPPVRRADTTRPATPAA